MAQQSARRGRKTRAFHCALSTLWVIWIRSANSHTGPQPRCCIRGRTDGSIRPRASFKKPLASHGASTDGMQTDSFQVEVQQKVTLNVRPNYLARSGIGAGWNGTTARTAAILRSVSRRRMVTGGLRGRRIAVQEIAADQFASLARASDCACRICPWYRASLPGYQGRVPMASKPGIVSMWRTIRRRIAASGKRPRIAPRLSLM